MVAADAMRSMQQHEDPSHVDGDLDVDVVDVNLFPCTPPLNYSCPLASGGQRFETITGIGAQLCVPSDEWPDAEKDYRRTESGPELVILASEGCALRL